MTAGAEPGRPAQPGPAAEAAAPRRRGRRPAGEDARAAIVAAARAEFAARGYEGATLRGIARAAGVDARLVHHYFDGKEDVFVAAMELPVRPQDVVARVVAGGVDGIGERLMRFFLAAWDTPTGRERLTAMLSAVVTSEAGAMMVRQFLAREILGRVAAAVGGRDPELRAALAASQVVGVIMARYIVRIEPIASADPEDLVVLVAPTLQRYLGGDLD